MVAAIERRRSARQLDDGTPICRILPFAATSNVGLTTNYRGQFRVATRVVEEWTNATGFRTNEEAAARVELSESEVTARTGARPTPLSGLRQPPIGLVCNDLIDACLKSCASDRFSLGASRQHDVDSVAEEAKLLGGNCVVAAE